MNRPRVTGVVLAGGRSSRFGSDKLAAEVAGSTLLDRAIDAVAQASQEVIVAGPAVEQARRSDAVTIRFVDDAVPFDGPLAALAGVLPMVGTELALVVGGDMPALVPEVLALLVDRLGATPAIDAVTLAGEGPKRQVLPMALRVDPGAALAAAAVRSGERSLKEFFARVQNEQIPASEWRTLDPRRETLWDVDDSAELERIRESLR